MTKHAQDDPGRPRLRALAACVPRAARVVDVGSDHGLLPRLLLRERGALACIATERRRGGPLERLIGRDPRLAVRFGDGLSALTAADVFDVIVIGGLGARTIIRILDRGRDRLSTAVRLVLQPQAEWPRLRGWLADNGFGLVEERLVAERGRFYLVLGAEHGATTGPAVVGLSADDLLAAGPLLVRDRPPTAIAYWRDRINRVERAIGVVGSRSAPRLDAELRRARRIVAVLCNPIDPGTGVCASPDHLPE